MVYGPSAEGRAAAAPSARMRQLLPLSTISLSALNTGWGRMNADNGCSVGGIDGSRLLDGGLEGPYEK